jgi:hypothetical protein
VFEALIIGHQALDVATHQVGRHATEIQDFQNGLKNCQDIFNKECSCPRPRPLTQREQQQLTQLIGWLGTLTLMAAAGLLAF